MKKHFLLGFGLALVVVMAAVMLWPEQIIPDVAAAQDDAELTDEAEDKEDGGDVQEMENAPPQQMIVAVEQNINGERYAGEVVITFEDPAELPDRPADAHGLFLSQSGQTLALGTGPIEVTVDVEAIDDEEPVTTINAQHQGDTVNVLITDNTTVYQDTTVRPEITPADIEAGQMTISRTLAPGSLSDLGDNMIIRVWGTLADGQLTADLLVYEVVR